MTKTTELIWLRSHHTPARASCLLLHGLNNHSQAMQSLALALNAFEIECALASIPGHSKHETACPKSNWAPIWRTSFHEQVNQFKAQSQSDNRLFLGNSLGALLAQCYDPLNTIFARQILLAPALYLNRSTMLLKNLCQLFNLQIPSLAPEAIRLHKHLPSNYYRALFELNQSAWKIQIPSLVFMAKNDELVNFNDTQKNLNVEMLTPLARPNHWITHAQNLKPEQWQMMLERIRNFFLN
jgi:alpha-beta hydrolase superfamily lysophospholipase